MKESGNWSVKTAQTIMGNTNERGYHPEIEQRWMYVNGMTLKALLNVGDLTGDEAYVEYVRKHMDLFVQEDGSIRTYTLEDYNLDQINQGKALFALWRRTSEPKYAGAAARLIRQIKGHPRTSEGGFWHKKIYPYQMWLDGLYMATPFIAEYAKTFDAPELFDEAARQLLLVEKHTRDVTTGLLHHGWDESREQRWCDTDTGKSRHFWCRGMGWYAMALVDALEHFPEEHPQRGTIIGIFERMMGALARVQDPNTGLWYQVLDRGADGANYLEASGSSMFVYAAAKGARLKYLSGSFQTVAHKGYQGLLNELVTETPTSVHVQGICHGAGLGGNPYRDGSYEYYLEEAVVRDVLMGMAPFLLASVEMERGGDRK
ncbi:glycoside hydrolase family 88 protein [Bacillus sp. 3255]|uniref:glycoside hydrolase family 88/105 protein n=1 Tax=Bacillus sp. 3255 TaxID=2817904 RepID=UPI0028612628|nr:glycoside hydrolase family 88 protein [Bacillus sp. 3255]MDR6884997.1 unsaturated rhamnogalacturonyl hydrolase [Bacillus sp. 3255]